MIDPTTNSPAVAIPAPVTRPAQFSFGTFLVGLVVGLVIGLFAGVVLLPLLEPLTGGPGSTTAGKVTNQTALPPNAKSLPNNPPTDEPSPSEMPKTDDPATPDQTPPPAVDPMAEPKDAPKPAPGR